MYIQTYTPAADQRVGHEADDGSMAIRRNVVEINLVNARLWT
jgi:hypothetical protein